jgi:putative aldouronate transport system permease protein
VLNEIIKDAENSASQMGGNLAEVTSDILPTQGLKYSTLVVVIVPVLCVYPFLQKYFAAGVTVGSVKE